MSEPLKSRVLDLLKIPAAPHVPPGEEAHAEVFRAGRGFYAYLRFTWLLKQIGALVGLAFATLLLQLYLSGQTIPGLRMKRLTKIVNRVPTQVLVTLEILGWVGFLFQLPLSYLLLRWDYECRFYVLTDRGLRIQEGLWRFREQTFSLANIQDLDVRRGPLQRLLGIGDLVVRTAGGGEGESGHDPTAEESLHVGRLRGVAEPGRIRDRLLERMRQHQDPGLGEQAEVKSARPDLQKAVMEVLAESRALRGVSGRG